MSLKTIATDQGDITLRAATLADLDAIRALHDTVYAETTQAFDESVLTPTEFLLRALEHQIRVQEYGHRRAQVLVAETEQGAIVGYSMARHSRPSFSWLDQEVVAKDYRHYGLGQAFTELVVDRAQQMKKKFVGLNVSEVGNVGFHARQGFVETGRRPPNANQKFATVVMQRKLERATTPDGTER